MGFCDWLKKRKERKLAARYVAGYDWAAGALLRGEITPAYVQRVTENVFDEDDEALRRFDLGAIAATDSLCFGYKLPDDRVYAGDQYD